MTHEAVRFVDLAGLHVGRAGDLNEALGLVLTPAVLFSPRGGRTVRSAS